MGRDGKLPWYLPADLAHFKSLTIGKPVVMGRKTFDSIGQPLPHRRNIVLTRDFNFAPDDVEIAMSLQDVFEMTQGAAEIAVIGGAEIFRVFAPYVETVYATEIDGEVPGDIRYPIPERPHTRSVIGEHAADGRNLYGMTFIRYDYESPAVP
jgi:dihydrofolate reductase